MKTLVIPMGVFLFNTRSQHTEILNQTLKTTYPSILVVSAANRLKTSHNYLTNLIC